MTSEFYFLLTEYHLVAVHVLYMSLRYMANTTRGLSRDDVVNCVGENVINSTQEFVLLFIQFETGIAASSGCKCLVF